MYRVLIALFALLLVGCGAVEHHGNLKAATGVDAQLKVERDAEDERHGRALAQIALEQRELRKELADAKRINAQMIAEMESVR